MISAAHAVTMALVRGARRDGDSGTAGRMTPRRGIMLKYNWPCEGEPMAAGRSSGLGSVPLGAGPTVVVYRVGRKLWTVTGR